MIIGVHGFKQSGKDTLADLLVNEFGFKKVAFADKVKESIHLIFNVPKEDLWGGDQEKQKLTTLKWTDFSAITPTVNRANQDFLNIRELMQIFATEVCRSQIPGIWYQFLDLKSHPNIVVSDLRFENEAQFLRSNSAFLIKVKRPIAQSSVHLSEKGIDDSLMDQILLNDKTLDDFLNNARKEIPFWIKADLVKKHLF